MAPKKVWVNGKWTNPKWEGAWGNHKRGGKIVVDWACGNCDQQADPAYLGCYANQDYCPRCWTHKSQCQHMTMATRTEQLKAGTLKPKAQANAEREVRKNAANPVHPQPGVLDEKAADDKFHAYLLDELIAERMSQEQVAQAKLKGRPLQGNAANQVQDPGKVDGAAGGQPAATTKPNDFDQPQGPTLREINNKLHHNKYILKLLEKDETSSPEQITAAKAAVKEWEDKQQAALPAKTKLAVHDKAISDLRQEAETASRQIEKGKIQLDWWREHVDAKVDALAVTNDKITAAEEGKRLFMLQEGIKEEPEEQPQEPEVKLDPFTREFKELVFEIDDSEEAAEAQKTMQLLASFANKKKAQGRAWAGADYEDFDADESSDEEEEENHDEYFQDEAEIMADIREQWAALPKQGEGKEEPKMTFEDIASFRGIAVRKLKERKAKDKEAKKTKESKTKEGKSKKPKANQVKNGNGKKNSTATSSKKDQVEQNAVNAGA